jgi:hypothetical protein
MNISLLRLRPDASQRFVLTLFALALCALNTAHAHSVWIEPVDGNLVARFAEPDGRLEKSPGYLDNLTAPNAIILVTNSPVSVEAPRKTNHFLLTGASPTNTACLETAFTVRGGRKPFFYARWQPAGAGGGTPLLTLDIVPTGKSGEARVWFRGEPLGGLKATLRTPDEKETELIADGEGYLRFEPKQSGQYLLTIAHHRENLPGFHHGVAYKQTSHNAALTWRQP